MGGMETSIDSSDMDLLGPTSIMDTSIDDGFVDKDCFPSGSPAACDADADGPWGDDDGAACASEGYIVAVAVDGAIGCLYDDGTRGEGILYKKIEGRQLSVMVPGQETNTFQSPM